MIYVAPTNAIVPEGFALKYIDTKGQSLLDVLLTIHGQEAGDQVIGIDAANLKSILKIENDLPFDFTFLAGLESEDMDQAFMFAATNLPTATVTSLLGDIKTRDTVQADKEQVQRISELKGKDILDVVDADRIKDDLNSYEA